MCMRFRCRFSILTSLKKSTWRGLMVARIRYIPSVHCWLNLGYDRFQGPRSRCPDCVTKPPDVANSAFVSSFIEMLSHMLDICSQHRNFSVRMKFSYTGAIVVPSSDGQHYFAPPVVFSSNNLGWNHTLKQRGLSAAECRICIALIST